MLFSIHNINCDAGTPCQATAASVRNCAGGYSRNNAAMARCPRWRILVVRMNFVLRAQSDALHRQTDFPA
jgi:hypothetical protein